MGSTGYQIKEMTQKTGVKAGTIRFYEKLGFLEPVERMSNQYRVFNDHHIYQIRICSLVFGGFVNTRLRKISMDVIAAAKDWDLEAYDRATRNYLQAIEQDIIRTKKAISIVAKQIDQYENDEREYSKKEAAELLGVTPETIRNWERNRLLTQKPAYSLRIYQPAEIRRRPMLRLL
ncbi:MAG: MerR family DNA-binding transcriptional regulator, partial [Lachnospiraceae bacterium]|nr:MerR family DNA-binding transcriptional regulator [Lachnospiraceae bacterium]